MPTILSWNLENLRGRSQRLAHIATLLTELNPDGVFIYEIMGGRMILEDICHRLGPSWHYIFQTNGDSRHVGFCYNSLKVQPVRIAWDPTSFPNTNRYQRSLWSSKDGFAEVRHRLYGLHRVICVNCTFTSDPNPVLLMGVHLKSMVSFRDQPSKKLTSQEKRTIQVRCIQEFFESSVYPDALVMGDFNSESAESCSLTSSSCNETTTPLDQGGIVRHVRPTNPLKTWRGSKRFQPTNLDLLYESDSINASLEVVDSMGLSDHNALKITWGTLGLSLIHTPSTSIVY